MVIHDTLYLNGQQYISKMFLGIVLFQSLFLTSMNGVKAIGTLDECVPNISQKLSYNCRHTGIEMDCYFLCSSPEQIHGDKLQGKCSFPPTEGELAPNDETLQGTFLQLLLDYVPGLYHSKVGVKMTAWAENCTALTYRRSQDRDFSLQSRARPCNTSGIQLYLCRATLKRKTGIADTTEDETPTCASPSAAMFPLSLVGGMGAALGLSVLFIAILLTCLCRNAANSNIYETFIHRTRSERVSYVDMTGTCSSKAGSTRSHQYEDVDSVTMSTMSEPSPPATTEHRDSSNSDYLNLIV